MIRDDWHVFIDDRDLFRRTVRIVVSRYVGDQRIEVFCNDGTVANIHEAEVGPDNAGWTVPQDALPAFAKAFDRFAPHKAEIDRLEEALRVERARVDRVLEGGG